MVLARSTRPGGTSWTVRALTLALLLAAGLLVGPALQDGRPPTAPVTTRARAVPAAPALSAGEITDRTRAVELLLRTRSAAVRDRDRAAFLATVDPLATALLTRQAALFDALAHVPLSTWEYVLDPAEQTPPDAGLDRRYGTGAWWAPDVVLRYGLAGFDPRPVVVEHALTFARRDGRWRLAADDDFALQGRPTPRALWDRGPVVAVRVSGVLVLGHPGHDSLLRDIATLTAQAVPRVTRAWGPWSGSVVVLVPADTAELAGLLGNDGDLSRLAAVATAELRGGRDGYDPTGDRVLINPEAFRSLGELGRRLVLTHEVTHVATRRASGPAVPSWLAEGLADVVGVSGLDLPLSVLARDLRREVRAGRGPHALPSDADFAGSSARLSASYQGAWFAVRLLEQRHGWPAVLRLYREVGARRDVPAAQALEDALRSQLGTTTGELTADWRAALQQQLG